MSRRLVIGLLLALALGGPTPGAVGSCDEEDGLADLVAYCEEREQLICWRKHLRGEFKGNEETVEQCRVTAIEECQRRRWAPDCRPTERQAGACINALKSVDTLDTKEPEIPECSQEALCRIETDEPSAAAIDGGAI